jgi:hypothetical protein
VEFPGKHNRQSRNHRGEQRQDGDEQDGVRIDPVGKNQRDKSGKQHRQHTEYSIHDHRSHRLDAFGGKPRERERANGFTPNPCRKETTEERAEKEDLDHITSRRMNPQRFEKADPAARHEAAVHEHSHQRQSHEPQVRPGEKMHHIPEI